MSAITIHSPVPAPGRRWAALWCALFMLALGLPARAERPRLYAIRDVRIVLAPGRVLERGTLVIRDGLIEAVGADVKVPEGAEVIEGKKEWSVYPAFIDAAAYLGLKQEPGARSGPPNIARLISQASRPGKGAKGAPHELTAVRPERRMVDQFDAGDSKIQAHRKLGFAVAQILPRKGVWRGETALISLRKGKARDLVIRDHLAEVASLQSGGFFSLEYPTSKMGAVATIRQTLLDARRQATWLDRYHSHPRGMERPPFRSSDSALMEVARGRMPVLFVAGATLDHGRFHALADEFNLKAISLALGCQETLARIREAGMPVIVPLKFPRKPSLKDDEEVREVDLQTAETYLRAPALPARLAQAGVSFALATAGMKSARNFSKNLHKAVQAGLSEEQALAALTTTPARLLGVSQILGTLEAGKIANVLVVEGNLFAQKPKWRELFVDGYRQHFEEKKKASKGEANEKVDPRGTWEIQTSVMGRTIDSTWTIEGSEGHYTGFSESEMAGKRDFTSLELSGNALTLRSSSPMGELEITVTLQGDTLEGETTVDTPQGSLTITVSGRRVSKPGANEQ